MSFESIKLVPPRFPPPLEPEFRPAVLANRAFQKEVDAVGVPLVIGLERDRGQVSRFETRVFPQDHPQAAGNFRYVERLVKFLLWQRGGRKVYIGGPRGIGEFIRDYYSPRGQGAFDYHFMGEQVYEQIFTVAPCDPAEAPPAFEIGQPHVRPLEGG